MLVINDEFLSCSTDTGFVLALPLYHEYLDNVGVLTKSYLKIMLLDIYCWGAYVRDKKYLCKNFG